MRIQCLDFFIAGLVMLLVAAQTNRFEAFGANRLAALSGVGGARADSDDEGKDEDDAPPLGDDDESGAASASSSSSSGSGDQRTHLAYMVFDVIFLNGHSLMALSLAERRGALQTSTVRSAWFATFDFPFFFSRSLALFSASRDMHSAAKESLGNRASSLHFLCVLSALHRLFFLSVLSCFVLFSRSLRWSSTRSAALMRRCASWRRR